MNPFQIMSEPIRRRIIEILASGEHMSGEISDAVIHEFGVTRSAVAKHLAILRANGWIDYRAEESAHHYRLKHDVWKKLDREVRHLKRLWKRRTGQFSGNDPLAHRLYAGEKRPYG